MAKTFNTTRAFSIRAASEVPQASRMATSRMTIKATMSIMPPLVPRGLARAAGNFKPTVEINPRKLAESPEATKATAMKYSARSAQPAIQPKPSPKITLIQEYAEPANGIAEAISA